MAIPQNARQGVSFNMNDLANTELPKQSMQMSNTPHFSNQAINIDHNKNQRDNNHGVQTKTNHSGTLWVHSNVANDSQINDGHRESTKIQLYNMEEQRHKMHEDPDDDHDYLYDDRKIDDNNNKKKVRISGNQSRPKTARPHVKPIYNESDKGKRRSFTITTDSKARKKSDYNGNNDDQGLTDFREILRKYQQNKDRDIDYTNYMNKNFDDDLRLEQQAKNRVFKRRETYASYLQYKHIPVNNDKEDKKKKIKER